MATVEINDSLQVYPVKAPVAGTVITRTANVGELEQEWPIDNYINSPFASIAEPPLKSDCIGLSFINYPIGFEF